MHFDGYLTASRHRHLDELMDFLRIPSISASPEHREDMCHAAEWLATAMRSAGLEQVEVMPTTGHPVVYADWVHAPGAPTALIYGHYDVQPVDPVHLWTAPPFHPVIRDGKLFARGASDDKGQVFMHVKAVEALLRTEGRLPLNLRFLVEGEEEIGSPSLPPFIHEHRHLVQADLVVISDSPFYSRSQPALCMGLRGLTKLDFSLHGPKGDLHSGLYGGAVQNPLHAMAELVASLHRPDGAVAVAGFYDRVRPPSPEERAEWVALGHDDNELRGDLGVPELFGEAGYTTLERRWARPTLELNGMWGGYQGEGSKTVIPSAAHAKITCRLVPEQDPDEIAALVQRHLQAHKPPGVELRAEAGIGARPVLVARDHPAVQAATQALATVYGVQPVMIRMGGSIPVVETFAAVLGVPVVLMGFGLPDENFHAPDEHFNLDNFDRGLRTICTYWHQAEGLLKK